MPSLERTERDFIRRKIRDMVRNARIGRVTRVYTHHIDPGDGVQGFPNGDNNNFEVDLVFPKDPENPGHREVTVTGPANNSISVPKVGDKVVVQYIGDSDKKIPFVTGTLYTAQDRAPKGEAGMYRQKYDSGSTPTGDGDLYFTGHNRYAQNPAFDDPTPLDGTDVDVEQAFMRLSKKNDAQDYPENDNIPMMVEMFDSPDQYESYINMEGGVVQGDDTKSMNVTLDFGEGTIVAKVDDSSTEFGFKVDVNTGEFTIIDGSGYGIESDGSGNFTWHHESIDFSEGTTTTL